MPGDVMGLTPGLVRMALAVTECINNTHTQTNFLLYIRDMGLLSIYVVPNSQSLKNYQLTVGLGKKFTIV